MALISYLPGMDYGVGYDELKVERRGDAVTRTAPEPVTGAAGQTVDFYLDRIESLEDLETALGLALQGSAGFGLFTTSAKSRFAENARFNSYALFLLVRVNVTNEFRQMRDVTLKQPALDLLTAGRAARFREQYGDVYVSGILTGGEYFAVLEVHTESVEEMKAVAREVESSVGVGGAGFSASAQFSASLRAVTEGRQVKVSSFQAGGADTRVATTADEIIDKAVGFAAQVAADKGVPYAVELQDYRTLDMPDVPNWVDLDNARDVLQRYATQRSFLVPMLNNLDYILLHQDEFEIADDSQVDELNAVREQFRTTVNAITSAASRAADDPTAAAFEQFSIPAFSLPKRIAGLPPVPEPGAVPDPVDTARQSIGQAKPFTIADLVNAATAVRRDDRRRRAATVGAARRPGRFRPSQEGSAHQWLTGTTPTRWCRAACSSRRARPG